MTDYPSQLSHYVDWCSQRLLIRPVLAADAPKFIAGSLRCSAQDLRFRFLNGVHRISEKLAAQLTQIDYDKHMAFVAEDVKGDILAVARLVKDACKRSAEYALIVRTDLQRQGMGRMMIKLLQDYAVGRGINEIWGIVDTENSRALRLAQALGFSSGFHIDLPFVRVVKSLA
jgi:acetyltransferase